MSPETKVRLALQDAIGLVKSMTGEIRTAQSAVEQDGAGYEAWEKMINDTNNGVFASYIQQFEEAIAALPACFAKDVG